MSLAAPNRAAIASSRPLSGLFWAERFVDGDCATFAHLHCPLRLLVTVQPERDVVKTGRHLHPSGRELPGRRAIHENLRALRIGVYLSPSDASRGFFIERGVELRLDVVFDLNVTGVGLITWQPQDQVVLPGSNGRGNWGCPDCFAPLMKTSAPGG